MGNYGNEFVLSKPAKSRYLERQIKLRGKSDNSEQEDGKGREGDVAQASNNVRN